MPNQILGTDKDETWWFDPMFNFVEAYEKSHWQTAEVIMEKIVAEAERRGKIKAYQEMKVLIDVIKTKAPYAQMSDIDSMINSRIQQYGKK